jgi:hypothetical protein
MRVLIVRIKLGIGSGVGSVIFNDLSSGHLLGHSVELSFKVFLDLIRELYITN